MSARAAWRLESMGFQQVYRYEPGKLDWAAAGLPLEGKKADMPMAGAYARRDVPTCRLNERLGEVRERVRASGWDVCLVVNEQGVLLGRLQGEAWNADANSSAEEVMEEGPTTIRPHLPLEAITERMQKRQVGSILVTDSDGHPVGILYRKDAEQVLGQPA